MQLIVDGVFTPDPWKDQSHESVTEETLTDDGASDIIVSEQGLQTVAEHINTREGRLGLRVQADVDLETIVPWIHRLALIAVNFTGSTDGRGFSLARRLRDRGFSGDLRASGPLIADQYAFARACGFDTVEIPDALAIRQPSSQWGKVKRKPDKSYQVGYAGGYSVLEARHRRIG